MSALSARKIALLSGAASPSLDLNFLSGSLDPRITFTRAAGSQSNFDATGTMVFPGTNIPRFDYDPTTLAPRGLLIEEARTNLLLNSASLGTQTVTVAAVANTLSFTGTGTVTLSGVSTAGPLVGTGVNNRAALTFTPTAGSLTCTVTGTVTNANLEAVAFGTSYITTTGASATRAADVTTMPVGPWFRQGIGTAVIDLAMLSGTAPGNHWLFDFNDGTLTNPVRAFYSSTFNYSAGSLNTFGGTAMASGVAGRFGMAWNANGMVASANGEAPVTTTGAPTIATVTSLSLGIRSNGASLGDIWLRRFRYWPRQLSAAELQAVTR